MCLRHQHHLCAHFRKRNRERFRFLKSL